MLTYGLHLVEVRNRYGRVPPWITGASNLASPLISDFFPQELESNKLLSLKPTQLMCPSLKQSKEDNTMT
jgi:hypothetical protein